MPGPLCTEHGFVWTFCLSVVYSCVLQPHSHKQYRCVLLTVRKAKTKESGMKQHTGRGSFTVTTARDGDRDTAVIAGC